jgi:predicted O-methyltransferase YrrM
MRADFPAVWHLLQERAKKFAIPIVQDYEELKYIFGLVGDCKSYLEIGTAEGNSLLAFSYSINPNAEIAYVDYGESHTANARNAALDMTTQSVQAVHGDSNNPETKEKLLRTNFEVVFIDAGHSYQNVITDARLYGTLATKFIIFHDVQLPEVKKAFDEYAEERTDCRAHSFINSATYGYGILKIMGEEHWQKLISNSLR